MSKKKNIEPIIEQMKQAGTYRPEFKIAIDLLAQTVDDCKTAEKGFKKSGGKMVIDFTNKNGTTNKAKNPEYVLVLELRETVTKLCRELGITPAGLRRINDKAMKRQKKITKLEASLKRDGSS